MASKRQMKPRTANSWLAVFEQHLLVCSYVLKIIRPQNPRKYSWAGILDNRNYYAQVSRLQKSQIHLLFLDGMHLILHRHFKATLSALDLGRFKCFPPHLLHNTLNGTVLLDHFLMVAVALLRVPCLDLLAHQHIDPHVLLLSQAHVEQRGIGVQKVSVSPVLFTAPIVASIIFAMLFMQVRSADGLPQLWDSAGRLSFLRILHFYLRRLNLVLLIIVEILMTQQPLRVHKTLVPIILARTEALRRHLVLIRRAPVIPVTRERIILELLIAKEIWRVVGMGWVGVESEQGKIRSFVNCCQADCVLHLDQESIYYYDQVMPSICVQQTRKVRPEQWRKGQLYRGYQPHLFQVICVKKASN